MLRNGFYNALGGAVRIGLAVLTIPALIRLMGIEEYGLWTLASAVVGLVTLAEAGLSTATTVFVAQDLAKQDSQGLSETLTVTVGAMLVLATSAAIALWIGAEPIVHLFPKLQLAQQLVAVHTLQIGGIVVWARLFQQILVGVEQASQRYGALNALNTIQWGLLSLGLFAIAWSGGRTVALMQWQAIVSLGGLCGHIGLVRSLLQGKALRPSWNPKKGLAVGRYSLMMWVTSLGFALFSRGDRLIVGNLLGTPILGVYAAITDIAAQINSFSALPIQPLLPHLSNLTSKPERERSALNRQVKQAVQINGLVSLGLGATLVTLSHSIVNVIFSTATSNQYLLPFCIAVVIYSLYSLNAVGYYILLGTSSINTCTAIILASGALSLILIAAGTHSIGIIGAILGNLGYLGTWSLAFLGMKKLYISKDIWMKWLGFPLMWYISVLLVNLLFAIDDRFKIGLAVLQNFILLFWYVINNKETFIVAFKEKIS